MALIKKIKENFDGVQHELEIKFSLEINSFFCVLPQIVGMAGLTRKHTASTYNELVSELIRTIKKFNIRNSPRTAIQMIAYRIIGEGTCFNNSPEQQKHGFQYSKESRLCCQYYVYYIIKQEGFKDRLVSTLPKDDVSYVDDDMSRFVSGFKCVEYTPHLETTLKKLKSGIDTLAMEMFNILNDGGGIEKIAENFALMLESGNTSKEIDTSKE